MYEWKLYNLFNYQNSNKTIFPNFGKKMIYFTADLHFYHDAIIEACYRPYKTGHQMHKALVKNFNEIVTDEDTVYILGDFSFSKDKEPIRRIVDKLNGQKHLILGNHDYLNPFTYVEFGFISVHTSLKIDLYGQEYILVHDPALSQVDRSKMFLCGHVHDLFLWQKNCINVGVDVHGFKPISEKDILNLSMNLTCSLEKTV